jgi:phosphotransferase system enzyme I (PtsI)
VFQNLDNHISQRAHDIYDIEKSLLRNLLGQRRETLAAISQPVIVLAHNLTPSETANLDRRFVQGFATELGGPGSHTAIVAEGLEIPAVVGIGPFLADVSGGEPVILDGNQGIVILQPDEETIARYRLEVEAARETLLDQDREAGEVVHPRAQSSPAARSSASMSSSEKPKWWPISWISTWRTMWVRSSPVSHQ